MEKELQKSYDHKLMAMSDQVKLLLIVLDELYIYIYIHVLCFEVGIIEICFSFSSSVQVEKFLKLNVSAEAKESNKCTIL